VTVGPQAIDAINDSLAVGPWDSILKMYSLHSGHSLPHSEKNRVNFQQKFKFEPKTKIVIDFGLNFTKLYVMRTFKKNFDVKIFIK